MPRQSIFHFFAVLDQPDGRGPTCPEGPAAVLQRPRRRRIHQIRGGRKPRNILLNFSMKFLLTQLY